LSLPAVIGSAALAAMLIDTIWFEIGRHRGRSVLNFICRTSLEPESCVDRTQSMFSRRGTWRQRNFPMASQYPFTRRESV
jgi:membrane protein DedA with SNARE-associated domain